MKDWSILKSWTSQRSLKKRKGNFTKSKLQLKSQRKRMPMKDALSVENEKHKDRIFFCKKFKELKLSEK